MMMSVLWYYRPEQTEMGMQPHVHGEVNVASFSNCFLQSSVHKSQSYTLLYTNFARTRFIVEVQHLLSIQRFYFASKAWNITAMLIK